MICNRIRCVSAWCLLTGLVCLLPESRSAVAQPAPAGECRRTENEGACGSDETGPNADPCEECPSFVQWTFGTILNCLQAPANRKECQPGQDCVQFYREYQCTPLPGGGHQCQENIPERAEFRVPTTVAAGDICQPLTPTTQPIGGQNQ